jgi:anthranilate synthase component 1
MDDTQVVARLEMSTVPYREPLDLCLLLRERYGEEQVFLLESLAGPGQDSKEAMVGVGKILSVSVRGTHITVRGLDVVCDRIARHAAGDWTCVGDGEFTLGSRAALWEFLRSVERCFRVTGANDSTGFKFGFFGYFGYDVIQAIEKLSRRIPEEGDEPPDVSLGIFSTILRFDLTRRTVVAIIATSSSWTPVEPFWNDSPVHQVEAAVPEVPAPDSIRFTLGPAEYAAAARKALEYIAAGDIYQVQIGHAVHIQSKARPLDVYRRLRVRNPAPYMYVASFSGTELIGSSPEVLFRTEAGKVTMRPLAGTIRRGANAQEDAEQIRKLQADPKEIAEHIMLVDLCRNDIGRVCEFGSLRVRDLTQAERYSHVYHLVSTVTANVAAAVDGYELIRATFPAGTMTGAPKIRAVEIIEELEKTRRSVYAGAVGYLDFGGDSCLALCIRTAAFRNGVYTIRASAGVVADSVPEREWAETVAKLGAPYWAVCGEELQA